jgi:hypothetical protein
MTENNENFSTPDITLATTLLTLNFTKTNTDFVNEGTNKKPRGYFCFKKSPALDEALKKYLAGDLAVEPKMFMANVRALKSEVNNNYENPYNRE